MYIPDNYDTYEWFENELARRERINRRLEQEENIDIDELPFYDDEGENE